MESSMISGLRETTLGPVAASERIDALDILRGLSLFGILAVNIYSFGGSALISGMEDSARFVDKLAYFIMEYVFSLKTFTLFSFLFGLGFAVQMKRAEQSKRPFARFYLGKLLILLCIGVAHHLLLWQGDILVLYSVLGFLLLLFRNAKPKTIALWFFVFLLIGCAIIVLGEFVIESFTAEGMHEYLKTLGAVFGSGSFMDTVAFRLYEFPQSIAILFIYQGPLAFAMFLAGLYVGKADWLKRLDSLPWLGRFAAICGALGLTFSAARFLLSESPAGAFMIPLANLGMTGFYAASVFLLTRSQWFRKLSLPVALAGRMALSNYIGQSILCCIIFCGSGLGLYDSMGPMKLLGTTAAVYALNLAFSSVWLRRMRFGPLEWAWRSLSYKKAQTMLRARS